MFKKNFKPLLDERLESDYRGFPRNGWFSNLPFPGKKQILFPVIFRIKNVAFCLKICCKIICMHCGLCKYRTASLDYSAEMYHTNTIYNLVHIITKGNKLFLNWFSFDLDKNILASILENVREIHSLILIRLFKAKLARFYSAIWFCVVVNYINYKIVSNVIVSHALVAHIEIAL